MKTAIKDSGQRKEFIGGGQRDTQEGKPRFDLLFLKGIKYEEQPIVRLARHLAEGAKKYSPRNWEQFCTEEAWDRCVSSGFRHGAQYYTKEDDEPHGVAWMCNAFFALGVEARIKSTKKAFDDAKYYVAASEGRYYAAVSSAKEYDGLTLEEAYNLGKDLGYENGRDDAFSEVEGRL